MVVPYVLPAHQKASGLGYRAAPSPVRPIIKPSAAPSKSSELRDEPSATAKLQDMAEKSTGADASTGQDQKPQARVEAVPSASIQTADRDGQVPAAPPEPAKDTAAAEPVLTAAVDVKFPKPFGDDEITNALQPILSFKISDDDAAAVKDAISKGDSDSGREALKRIADPAARAFAEWKRLRGSNGFDDILAFRKAHPLFPEPIQDAGIEKSLFLSNASSVDILRFYANRNPQTAAGKASLGAALMETGERERGLALIRFVWSRYVFDSAVQERFISRFGQLLDENDRGRRDRLIAVHSKPQDDAGKSAASGFRNGSIKRAALLGGKSRRGRSVHGGRHSKRWQRAGRGKARRRGEIPSEVLQKEAASSGKAGAFPIVPISQLVKLRKGEPHSETAENKSEDAGKQNSQAGKPDVGGGKPGTPQPIGEKPAETAAKTEAKDGKPAQNSLQAKTAEKAFHLRKERAGGPSALLAKLKSLRREGADDDLWSLLRSIDPDAADLADPDRWWDFRRSEVRRALIDEHPKTAYAIAKMHGPLDDDNRSEAEFMAGWIALRFLKDPHRAQPHFEAAYSIKSSVREETRAAYWLGRTKLELGSRAEADRLLSQAASRFYTFYGALAAQALRKGMACEFRAPPQPSQNAITAFINEDAFKALMIAKQLGFEPLLITFFLDLARQVQDPEQMTLMLELAERIAPPHVAVRAAKIALLRGFATEAYAYPTLLPKFDAAGGNGGIELALLSALTRQESEFHTGSVSSAGARGLMQLMPQTAKIVAASAKIKYELPRLISDPSYNVTLGSAFLAQLLSGYNGSYVLSLVAYNAGPGRAAQWIDDFGDPRDKSVDPIDWIERIPFNETRNYVQRILESTQLYRCRLKNGKVRIQLVEDLHRGRPGKIPNFADVSGSAELDLTP